MKARISLYVAGLVFIGAGVSACASPATPAAILIQPPTGWHIMKLADKAARRLHTAHGVGTSWITGRIGKGPVVLSLRSTFQGNATTNWPNQARIHRKVIGQVHGVKLHFQQTYVTSGKRVAIAQGATGYYACTTRAKFQAAAGKAAVIVPLSFVNGGFTGPNTTTKGVHIHNSIHRSGSTIFQGHTVWRILDLATFSGKMTGTLRMILLFDTHNYALRHTVVDAWALTQRVHVRMHYDATFNQFGEYVELGMPDCP